MTRRRARRARIRANRERRAFTPKRRRAFAAAIDAFHRRALFALDAIALGTFDPKAFEYPIRMRVPLPARLPPAFITRIVI